MQPSHTRANLSNGHSSANFRRYHPQILRQSRHHGRCEIGWLIVMQPRLVFGYDLGLNSAVAHR
jgi:hypothetical protein